MSFFQRRSSLRPVSFGAAALLTSGVLASSGIGTAAFTGTAIKPATWSAAGTGAASFTGRSTNAHPFSSAGTGTATWVGRSTNAHPFSSAGTGTATWVGRALKPRPFSSAGTGAASWVGRSFVAHPFSSAGVGSASWVGRAIKPSIWSTSGVGSASFVGSTSSSKIWTSAGHGTASWVGRSTRAAALSSSGVGTASWVGRTIKRSPFSAAGTGTATWVGAKRVVRPFSAAGSGVASWVGRAIKKSPFSAAGVGAAAWNGFAIRRAFSIFGTGAAAWVGYRPASESTYEQVVVPGRRLLYADLTSLGIRAFANGGNALVGDTIALCWDTPAAPTAANLVDWFYLNGTKTAPTTGLTSGNALFTTPSLAPGVTRRKLTVFYMRNTAPAFLDGSGNPQTTEAYDSVVLEIRPEHASVLEMEFWGSGKGWTIVYDWYQTPGISWRRGLPGYTITDLVADIGQLNFTLDNSDQNSGGVVGYYSPDHGSKRYGFYLNIGVRYRIGTTVRFTGQLAAIDPVPGKWGPRTVSCEAVDWMSVADRTRISNLPVLVNKKGDEVFQTLIDSLQSSSKPTSVEKDSSLDTFPYTLDRTRDEETVLRDEMYRLCKSGMSLIWLRGDGTLVFEDRSRRANITSDADTFFDSHGFSLTQDRSAVINRVQSTIHPRVPAPSDVIMYSMTTPLPLTAGQTVTVMGPWTDPANPNVRVGAVSLVSLLSGTDFVANTAADGSGTDITSQLTVVPGLSGNATSFTIIVGTSSGYLTKLQQRGKPLYDYGALVLKWEDGTSIAQFGVSSVQIDMPYSADAQLALEVAQFAVYKGSYPSTNIESFTRIVSVTDATELSRSIIRNISDRIGITDLVTGVSKSFYINGIDESESDGVIKTQWLLMPADTTSYWYLEIPGRSELNATTRTAFGQILGHTDIAHGDTHADAVHFDSAHIDSHGDAPHTDVAHVDGSVHNDGHGDTGAHYDTAHADTHADSAHNDASHVDNHLDVAHQDVPHTDAHYDVPFFDQAHNDYHTDNTVSTPSWNFYDHGDEYGQAIPPSHYDGSTFYLVDNIDGYSHAHSPGTDPRPNGALHYDDSHTDIRTGAAPPQRHVDAESGHYDVPHGDSHDDAHGDSHGDIAHTDATYSTPHTDVPAQSVHNDVPHTDVPAQSSHTDAPHQDLTTHTDSSHVDSTTHIDTAHQDIAHNDVAHQDAAHQDVGHVDTHSDSVHGDLH